MNVFYHIIILISTGIIVGFINTIAGGASSLLYPVLIFLGIPVHTAFGTGRIAFLAQGIFSTAGFKSKGYFIFPYNFHLAISGMAGAVIGAELNLQMPDKILQKILSLIIVVIALLSIGPGIKPPSETKILLTPYRKVAGIFLFFLIGIYGGFLHTGTGLIIILVLTFLHRMNIHQANSIKGLVVLVYTIPALVIFALADAVEWQSGLWLALGTSTGAWIASRWSVKKSDKKIRKIFATAAILLAVKLWFYS